MSSRTNNRKSGPPSREVQVSKKLSWLLRHGAEKEGLKLDQDGYINLSDVLANRNIKSLKITFDEVRQIVENNDKQRFSLIPKPSDESSSTDSTSPSTDPSNWLIRANQGHSIKIDDEGTLLTTIAPENRPATVVHGTTHSNWVKIVESGGLKPMGRNHVHFASGLPNGFKALIEEDSATSTAAPVISGMRSSSTIIMYLDLVKAMDAGIMFGLSQNGVILTSGDQNGLVPLTCFSRVEDRTGEGVLLENGTVVKEASSSWTKKTRPTS